MRRNVAGRPCAGVRSSTPLSAKRDVHGSSDKHVARAGTSPTAIVQNLFWTDSLVVGEHYSQPCEVPPDNLGEPTGGLVGKRVAATFND